MKRYDRSKVTVLSQNCHGHEKNSQHNKIALYGLHPPMLRVSSRGQKLSTRGQKPQSRVRPRKWYIPQSIMDKITSG